MTIWRMRIAYWVTKATNTHSGYVILKLLVFTPRQWLHERSSMLRYIYIVCLVDGCFCLCLCLFGNFCGDNFVLVFFIGLCSVRLAP